MKFEEFENTISKSVNGEVAIAEAIKVLTEQQFFTAWNTDYLRQFVRLDSEQKIAKRQELTANMRIKRITEQFYHYEIGYRKYRKDNLNRIIRKEHYVTMIRYFTATPDISISANQKINKAMLEIF